MTRRRAITLAVQAAAFLAAVAFLALLPHWLSDFRASEVAYVGIYFIAILGLNILTGYTGQISLGHGAFMAIGGYTTAMLVGHHNVRDLWTIPPAGLIAGGAGLLFGLPALRLSGLYLALATFGFAVALPAILKKFDDFTGRTEGIQLFGRPGFTGKGYENAERPRAHPDLQRLALLPELDDRGCPVRRGVGRARWADRTHFPRDSGQRGRRDILGSEPPAVQDARVRALRLLRRHRGLVVRARDHLRQSRHVPDRPLLYLLIGAVISGLGSIWGIAAGALFIQYVPDLASDYVSKAPGAPSVAYAIILIIVVLLMPFGLTGLIRKATRPLTDRLFRGS